MYKARLSKNKQQSVSSRYSSLWKYSVVTRASPSWKPEQSTGKRRWQSYGSLMTPNSVQNGVPVSLLRNQAAAMLPNLAMPDLKPRDNANADCSLGSCEFSSHMTNLSQCVLAAANR